MSGRNLEDTILIVGSVMLLQLHVNNDNGTQQNFMTTLRRHETPRILRADIFQARLLMNGGWL